MPEDSSSGSLRRRDVLRLGATAVAGLAGCPGGEDPGPKTETPSPPPTTGNRTTSTASGEIPAEYVERFDSVVDVTEEGADPSGSRPIDDVVRSVAEDGVLLAFPDGRYRVDSLSMPAPDAFGLVAPSGADAALVPTGGDPDAEWFLLSDVTDFVYDGLDFDFRETGPVGGTVFSGPGDMAFRNLRVRGGYRTFEQQLMRIDVTDEDGQAVVENLVAAGVDEAGVNTTGLYVGRTHAGTITIRDCRLEGFSDNGLYASPPGGDGGRYDAKNGAVHVRGGLYRNNNIAGVRIGSTGSTVKGATVVVDRVPRHMDDASLNARGIRLRGKRDQLVENCRIVYGPDAGQTSGALTINGMNGNATIRDVDVEMNRDDTRAILAKAPEIDGDVAPTFENVTVSGSAAGEQTATITGRPGTTFDGCCFRQSGKRRDGIEFVRSENCTVDDSRIDVSGDPIVLKDSSLRSGYVAASNC